MKIYLLKTDNGLEAFDDEGAALHAALETQDDDTLCFRDEVQCCYILTVEPKPVVTMHGRFFGLAGAIADSHNREVEEDAAEARRFRNLQLPI